MSATRPTEFQKLAELQKLAAEASDARTVCAPALLRCLARLIADASLPPYPPEISPDARAMIDVILLAGLKDADRQCRREIAEILADAARPPRGTMLALIHDAGPVASPLLSRSRALREADLLDVVAKRSIAHAIAIARRKRLSPTLADAIAATDAEDALIALADNRHARFPPSLLERLIDRARTLPALQAPLAMRLDMPARLLTQLYFFAPSPLKREILDRSELLDPALVDEAVGAVRAEILRPRAAPFSPGAGDANAFAEASRFLRERVRAGEPAEALLTRLAAEGRRVAFAVAFGHFAGVDPTNADRMLRDKSWEALAIACRASGLAPSAFALMIENLLKMTGDPAGADPAEIEKARRILELYARVPSDAAEQVMRFWRVGAEDDAGPAAAQGGEADGGEAALDDIADAFTARA